jgi:3-phenylpropionate/trans-cinnamate dioxygenase ferredoxin subunit
MTWVKAASVAELPASGGACRQVGDQRIALFRVGEAVYGLGDRCSHAEASLAEGELFDLEVECPRHGSSFDLVTGEPKSLPATRPVSVYEVKVEDGDVLVWLEGQ